MDEAKSKSFFPFVLMLGLIGTIIASIYYSEARQYADARKVVETLIADEQFDFLTISPEPFQNSGDNVGGFLIIDSQKIEGPDFGDHFLAGIVGTYEDDKWRMDCFNPHHAIRSASNPKLYVVVCFECGALRVPIGDSASLSDVARSVLFQRYEEFIAENDMTTYWDTRQ